MFKERKSEPLPCAPEGMSADINMFNLSAGGWTRNTLYEEV